MNNIDQIIERNKRQNELLIELKEAHKAEALIEQYGKSYELIELMVARGRSHNKNVCYGLYDNTGECCIDGELPRIRSWCRIRSITDEMIVNKLNVKLNPK